MAKHTTRCYEAQDCGHPRAHCVCSPFEVAHEKYSDIKTEMLKLKNLSPGMVVSGYLHYLHDDLLTAFEEDAPCRVCRMEDGP